MTILLWQDVWLVYTIPSAMLARHKIQNFKIEVPSLLLPFD